MEIITLGGGCNWCIEAAFQLVKGVTGTVVGYAGGSVPHPSYEAVYSGKTGHAEVAQVTFDPTVISLEDILDVFWIIHDPTTLNRQGPDVGTAYRSIILYNSDEQKAIAERSKEVVAKLWPDPIVTEIVPFTVFYNAGAEHQNYYRNNQEARYCQIIINPKLDRLRQKFAEKLA
ncbi:MAG TPA: peptide-methionine (S)-S-oxide reductase MsrA [Candidatus Saccharimonadia bacterium]